MIDLTVHNKLDPKKGRLLITEPFETSEYFQRSVILLCEHNSDGSFGFVLNNYADVKLNEFEGMPDFDTRISIGGPVSSRHLYYIHTLGDKLPDSIPVFRNIYAGGDFELLKTMLRENRVDRSQVRFFMGYSGWMEKQLEGEIKSNAWLVDKVHSVKQLMDVDNDNLWPELMSRQGGKYKAFAHFPKNPGLN